jgi:hypothetical protein
MAADAAAHGRNACILRYGFDLGDVAVAHGGLTSFCCPIVFMLP